MGRRDHHTHVGGHRRGGDLDELLSRFGSDDSGVQLDKLGGAAWQGRKAKMRARIKMLAEQLIAIAAKRAMRHADAVEPATGTYDEFCARFPYAETEDQENAIADVIEDLAKGQPMDRLVCGDVGFGKTEVALRAAFVMAMTGRQVAVIAPTTLLARQHYKNFAERFKGFPLKVAQLSRMVTAADQKAAKVKDLQAENTLTGEMTYGTDGQLAALGLVVMTDTKGVQAVYEPAPTVRQATLDKYPQIKDLLDPVFKSLSLETLQTLNAKIAVDGEDAKKVAADYLTEKGFLK